MGTRGYWWPRRGTEEGVAFPGHGLCSAFSVPGLLAEDLLPRAPESEAGQALSRLNDPEMCQAPSIAEPSALGVLMERK